MTTENQHPPFHRRFWDGVARRFVRGVILLFPLLLTFWLVKFAFDTLDGLLQPAIAVVFGRELTGLGVAIIVVALLLVGAVASTSVFRWTGRGIERGIISTPGIGSIYGTTKKLLPGSGPGEMSMGFDTVVRVEYPRHGVWTVGFLMGVVDNGQDGKLGVVYMPSTPMPQSGWLIQVPLSEIETVNWSSSVAMQYIISAGVTSPSSIQARPMEISSRPK